MNRVSEIPIGAMLVLAVVLAGTGCAPSPGSAPSPTPPSVSGTVKFYVTDAPRGGEVTSIIVTASRLEIHKAGADQEREQRQQRERGQAQGQAKQRAQEQQQARQEEAGWVTIDIPPSTATFDLLKFKGIEQTLATSQVETGRYTQIRLTVDKIKVGLGNKTPQDARVPSNVLRLPHAFAVVTGETTAIVLDFDADRMVTVTGAGEIMVKPVLKVSTRGEKPTAQPGPAKPEKKTSEQPAVEVSGDDFGKAKNVTRELKVAVGESFAVTLCSNPTTGFKWSELAQISDPAMLQQTDHEYVAPQATGGTPPPAGTAGKEV